MHPPELQVHGEFTHARAVAIVLPGARCRAQHYTWIADALLPVGVAVCIVDPPERNRPALSATLPATRGRFVSADDLHAAIRWIHGQDDGLPLVLIGHSLGGVVLLEQLDPAEGRRNPLNRASPQEDVIAWGAVTVIATLGSALERAVGSLEFPWRSSDSVLSRPRHVELLMFAGSRDAIVPPAAVAQTARRFTPSGTLIEVPGATHFGWVDDDTGEAERVAEPDAMSQNDQQATTGACLARELLRVLSDRADRPA